MALEHHIFLLMPKWNITMTVSDGTRAPHIPANAKVVSSEVYNNNVIVVYRRK